MITLNAKIRKEKGKKVGALRERGLLPAVLYGPKIKDQHLTLDLKEFQKAYEEAGESSLLNLKVAEGEEYPVLIHEVQINPINDLPLHIDFYQPNLEEEVEATIELVFEGEAPAVKELGGVLVKSISEVEVRALPQNLPREIIVKIDGLKTLEDNISIKDLAVSANVIILKEPDEVVASVVPPRTEEELKAVEAPSPEEVEIIGKEAKEGETGENEKEEE